MAETFVVLKLMVAIARAPLNAHDSLGSYVPERLVPKAVQRECDGKVDPNPYPISFMDAPIA